MRDTVMWISLPLTVALALTAAVADSRSPSGKTELVYPVVPGHGGVVPLPRAAEQPRKGAKAVFDITADAKPDAVNMGLEYVAGLLNLYGAAGLKAGDVKIAAVLHGEATKAVLSDTAYAARFKAAANPNLPLIRDLKKAGVELNRKVLADMALTDPAAFGALVSQSKAALEKAAPPKKAA